VQWHITEKVDAMFTAFPEYNFAVKDVCAMVVTGAGEDGHVLYHSKDLYRRCQQNKERVRVWFLVQRTGTSTFRNLLMSSTVSERAISCGVDTITAPEQEISI
jgi:hypothetical protein